MSPYLEKPSRTLEQIADEFDYVARKIREDARHTIIVFRQGNIPTWTQNHALDCLRFARKAHSKAIANREAYRAAIGERDMQRSVLG